MPTEGSNLLSENLQTEMISIDEPEDDPLLRGL